MLAWVEYLVGGNGSQELIIYDLKLNSVRSRYALLLGGEVPVGPLRWGTGGITLRAIFGSPPTETFLVFDPTGSTLLINFQVSEKGGPLVDAQWVKQVNQDYFGVLTQNGSWVMLNPVAKTQLTPTGLPALYNPAVPDGISLYMLPGNQGTRWLANFMGQELPLPFTGLDSQISISPDGTGLAYVTDAAYIFYPGRIGGGQIIKIPGTERIAANRNAFVVWSYGIWRVQDRQIVQPPPQANTTPCPGSPPTRLGIGATARVAANPPQANALNSQPGRPSQNPNITRLALIPVGGVFTVISGPVCSDNLRWWQVNYNNVVGWTAEGEGNIYWVEPLSGSAASQCPPNLPPRLTVGGRGRVPPGEPNALRSLPSKDAAISKVVGAIPGRGVFTVTNGPVCADGYTWWEVNYQGNIGWTPEGENVTYWLEPLICGFNLPSRLRAGTNARVTPGLPNAIRSQPSRNGSISAVLGEIPAAAVFAVLSGPQCGDGYVWWQVNYNGLIGWTPEGEGETYWLEPLQ